PLILAAAGLLPAGGWPVVREKCQICHRPGTAAPFALTAPADVRPRAATVREAVAEGRMPPWHADSAAGRFKNDRGLTAGAAAAPRRGRAGRRGRAPPAGAARPRRLADQARPRAGAAVAVRRPRRRHGPLSGLSAADRPANGRLGAGAGGAARQPGGRPPRLRLVPAAGRGADRRPGLPRQLPARRRAAGPPRGLRAPPPLRLDRRAPDPLRDDRQAGGRS